jgi:preprotein translocase subunit SecB
MRGIRIIKLLTIGGLFQISKVNESQSPNVFSAKSPNLLTLLHIASHVDITGTVWKVQLKDLNASTS